MKIEKAVLQLWEAVLADESLPQPDWREVARLLIQEVKSLKKEKKGGKNRG